MRVGVVCADSCLFVRVCGMVDPTLPRTTVQLSENGAVVTEEEGGFATFEMRRSQRASQRAVRPKAPPAAIATAGATANIPVYAK